MRTSLTAVAVVLLALFVVGCSQPISPTSPTTVASVGNGTVAALSATGFQADVIAIKNNSGTPAFDAVVSIPSFVNTAARTGNAPFAIRIVVTYLSSNNTVETFDSGPVPITSSIVLATDFTKNVDVIQLALTFSSPLPGANPSFSATAGILTL